jgi:hypothetical protein
MTLYLLFRCIFTYIRFNLHFPKQCIISYEIFILIFVTQYMFGCAVSFNDNNLCDVYKNSFSNNFIVF